MTEVALDIIIAYLMAKHLHTHMRYREKNAESFQRNMRGRATYVHIMAMAMYALNAVLIQSSIGTKKPKTKAQ